MQTKHFSIKESWYYAISTLREHKILLLPFVILQFLLDQTKLLGHMQFSRITKASEIGGHLPLLITSIIGGVLLSVLALGIYAWFIKSLLKISRHQKPSLSEMFSYYYLIPKLSALPLLFIGAFMGPAVFFVVLSKAVQMPFLGAIGVLLSFMSFIAIIGDGLALPYLVDHESSVLTAIRQGWHLLDGIRRKYYLYFLSTMVVFSVGTALITAAGYVLLQILIIRTAQSWILFAVAKMLQLVLMFILSAIQAFYSSLIVASMVYIYQTLSDQSRT